MKKKPLALAITLMVSGPAFSAAFVNGGFEDGNTSNWSVGTVSRTGNLSTLVPSSYLNGATGRSAIVTPGLDPIIGASMANRVYSGNYAYRVEDTTSGGYLSVISQTVTNYTESNIFFAWMAVLEGAHSAEQAAGMKIQLTDLTTNTDIISRIYSAEFSAVDNRFSLDNSGYYYTPVWQIEQLSIDQSLQGHDFRLTVLATDCDPTAHTGYVYLDGFGAQLPPVDNGVPEPATLALLGLGVLGMGITRRRKSA
ncbi:MAG: PEP-CTERM sorting domain-containing protein [Thiobacillus sp.]|nr:PEP-CTERM sorting domain-containing protein [Thiobacillus sp.]